MASAAWRTAGAETAPRYEFRIWAPSLAEVKERLEKLAGPRPAERGREMYVVSDATNDTNTKIRAGVMEVKVLLRIDLGLEQWNPYLKVDFPINTELIVEQIFPTLHIAAPALRQQLFTAEAFIEVLKWHPRLAAVELNKIRHRYVLSGCAAEFVEVEINGSVSHSVAVESTIPLAVLDAVSELAISDNPNVSYVRQIKSVLGRGLTSAC
jgi:exopolyphosphatase / guanosine-5'-triphosphate,3'-diphosphate pyrophosphatase